MLATLPVDAPPQDCRAKPQVTVLYADAEKKRKVELPPGAMLRECASPADGAQVMTKPDSGGTEMCIFYEMPVDPKNPQIQIKRQRAGVTKSLPDKSCPEIDMSRANYPGKLWFFLSENVVLANAFKVKEKVETQGLAFIKSEKTQPPKTRPAADYGNAPLSLMGIAQAGAIECRKNAGFFQGRYAACYRAEVYNPNVRGDRTLVIGLTKNGEYRFIESIAAGADTRGAP